MHQCVTMCLDSALWRVSVLTHVGVSLSNGFDLPAHSYLGFLHPSLVPRLVFKCDYSLFNSAWTRVENVALQNLALFRTTRHKHTDPRHVHKSYFTSSLFVELFHNMSLNGSVSAFQVLMITCKHPSSLKQCVLCWFPVVKLNLNSIWKRSDTQICEAGRAGTTHCPLSTTNSSSKHSRTWMQSKHVKLSAERKIYLKERFLLHKNLSTAI